MGSKHKNIIGRVYFTSDSYLTKSRPKRRRVVAINNNKNEMHVKRILSAGKGRNSQKGIQIEKYPDIPLDSVVENRTFRKSINNQFIKEKKLKKTNTRLNKWDMAKLKKHRN